jgi:DNA-binding NarL/FixJ family response regulator
VAQALGRHAQTITNELRSIMDKLGVASRVEMIIVVLSAARAAEKSSER